MVARTLADPSRGLDYLDETWFVRIPPAGLLNPEPGYGWAPAGHPPALPSCRTKGRDTWSAYLCLEAKEDRVAWQYTAHTNSTETVAVLEARVAVHALRGHRRLVVVWDPASWHRARAVKTWQRAHNRQVLATGTGVQVILVELPVHAFWLDPVEGIIQHVKGAALPGRTFESVTAQQAAIDRHLIHRNLHRASVKRPEEHLLHLH